MMMDKYSFLQIRHDSYILNTAIFAYNFGSLRIVVSTSGCGPENLGSIPRGCTPAFFISQSSGVRCTVENDSIVRRHQAASACIDTIGFAGAYSYSM